MCHPEGRSAAEGARSALTRRPSRSYPRSPLVEPIGQGSAHPLLFEESHTELIRAAFSDLQTDFRRLEAMGADDPTPLRDLWPGVDRVRWCESGETLWTEYAERMVVRCDRIVDADGEPAPVECVRRDNDILLVRMDDERLELEAVAREIDVWGVMDEEMLDAILDYGPPHDVEAARTVVRSCASDAERLLAAVGEDVLCAGLPKSLQEILSADSERS